MRKDHSIYVAGHRGMVGSAIVRALTAKGYDNILTRDRKALDLTDPDAVTTFFKQQQPDFVFLAAAKVGGIVANDTYGGDFIRENLQIQTNVIDAAWRNGTRKLCFLGSSCIYPREAPQPMHEDLLLTGPLEPTNLPYAVAKIAGKVMCDAYRKQHGFEAFTAMPSNVYGVGDNFHPENSHVIAALMRRFHEAKERGDDQVDVWGTGKPLREFIFADDVGDACVFLMEHYQDGGAINLGTGQEVSIKALAETVRDVIGLKAELVWDDTKPDGTMRKLMDNRKLAGLGWAPKTSLRDGLTAMYAWYLEALAKGADMRAK
ncbi:GDP-L-fucose synthase family protein [Yoonia sp. SS1-5]|uniref:GDP-L-fucose synthase n=1 Tax=Yoonia rhodophyticola TaxID=3137370 RepID=A0ABZ3JBN8_9RHOB